MTPRADPPFFSVMFDLAGWALWIGPGLAVPGERGRSMLAAVAIAAGDSSLCQWQDERTQRPGAISVEPSSDVAGTVTRFYEAIERGTVAAFDDVISSDPVAMVIGTDRWVDDRATWREAFPNLRGITVEGSGARGFRHEDSGWIVDRPIFVLPDGGRLPARLTAVTIQENDRWTIVHIHISVQVPDDVAVAEAADWHVATTL